jgi:hypothetical protein
MKTSSMPPLDMVCYIDKSYYPYTILKKSPGQQDKPSASSTKYNTGVSTRGIIGGTGYASTNHTFLESHMGEPEYQARLIKRLSYTFPGCVILKNDPQYMQGVPDLAIFYYNMWAMLEVKIEENAPTQPNQPYYVDLFSKMSFGAFIYPENEEEVFRELQLAFCLSR